MEEKKEIRRVKYTDDESKYRGALIRELCRMRDDRDQPHPELDGMTYLEYYENNRKKDLSYIAPKKNRTDMRIVTGTTREKDTTLLSTLLNLNLEPDVTAFDSEDMVVAELGDNMSDLVHKSREIENYDKKRPILYRELISQGDVFIQEIHVDDFRNMPIGQLEWDPNSGEAPVSLNFKDRLEKVFSGCSVRMVNGKKVYLGNIRKEYIEDQDSVAILNIYKRDEAKSIYGKWERWQYVPDVIETTEVWEDGTIYKDWSLVNNSDKGDDVAEIMIFEKRKNRFMILLNGVMMLPINYPLTAISPTGETMMSQGKLEPISDFAYSKSQPSKTKVDQAIIDEMSGLMVEAMRQTRKPPMGNSTKRVLGSSIFLPGKITQDITKEQLFPLLPNGMAGITASEFSFYNLIKESLNDKTTNDVYGGNQTEGQQTATEVLELKNQQMLKLGSSMDGVVNLERHLTWLRIQNILMYWTKPMDTGVNKFKEGLASVYRTVSVDTTLEDGQKGTKIFRFTTDKYPDEYEQHDEEEFLTKKHGQNVRIVYMDPEMLRTIKYVWFIIINPTPKSNDKLSQLLFVQNLTQAIELFGPDALNQEYCKQRYAILINEDYNKMFKKLDVMTMLQQGIGTDGAPVAANSKISAKNVITPQKNKLNM